METEKERGRNLKTCSDQGDGFYSKDLNIRPEIIKLLEENIGRTLNDINQSKIL